MSIVDLESRLQHLAEVLAALGLGRYDLEIAAGDDALGAVEEGVNGLMLDLETLHLANEEKAAYLGLQQSALNAKEAQLRDTSADLAQQLATIERQRALLDTRERELAAMQEKVERQSEAIRELAVPVIEVEDGIVALPLIGAIDAVRAQEIMQTLLQHVVATRSHHVILDLTGVAMVDTQTADYITKVVGAVRLVGARCVVSGVNPLIAQTLVDLGVDLGAIRTFRNLKESLRDSLRAAQARRARPR